LPDYVQVWPGHGAGSACGKALGAVPSTTVGYEKIRNWALQYNTNEEGFTKSLLSDQPEPPQYFAVMKKLNKVKRDLLTSVPKLTKLDDETFMKAYQSGMPLIDTRNKMDFAKGFIPGSLNIQNNNSFSTWAGSILNYEEPFMLLADESQLDDLTRKLMRVGLDKIHGYITSTYAWGNALEKANNISLPEFKRLLSAEDVQVVDVRNATEYKAGHIQGAEHVFVGTLEDNLDKISKDKKVVIHCQAGDRSSIAYSVLAKHGFKNVVNYSGGMSEWEKEKELTVKGNA
jgi:hydroxyacylglutathione hydrolase